MSDRQPVIVFALFPGVTQLDFTGPHQVFSSLPGAKVILASAAGGTIPASSNQASNPSPSLTQSTFSSTGVATEFRKSRPGASATNIAGI